MGPCMNDEVYASCGSDEQLARSHRVVSIEAPIEKLLHLRRPPVPVPLGRQVARLFQTLRQPWEARSFPRLVRPGLRMLFLHAPQHRLKVLLGREMLRRLRAVQELADAGLRKLA